MALPLNRFITEIKQRNVAKGAKYSISLSAPRFMMTNPEKYKNLTEKIELVELFAESVQMPEFTTFTMPIRDEGQIREIVYDKQYQPIVCTFICDSQMEVKYFFDEWVKGSLKTDTGTFKYLNDYAISEMVIYQLDEAHKETYKMTLYEVYPKLVNDIAYSAYSKDYNRCQVQFVYKNWKSERIVK